MFIQNVSLASILKGDHLITDNMMLIRILDLEDDKLPAYKNFKEIHEFEFVDAEEYDDIHEELKIQDDQAAQLVDLLQHALDNHMDVIVHCTAGICRSGAVVEVAVMMGFEDLNTYRQPNLMVKKKMMKYLGWSYE